MSKYIKAVLATALLFGSATATLSRPAGEALESDSLRIQATGLQVAQFNSRPAQSSDGRFDSFGGY